MYYGSRTDITRARLASGQPAVVTCSTISFRNWVPGCN